MLVNWHSENLPLFIDSNMAVQQHNVLLEELFSQRALMNHWCRFQCRNPRKGCLSLHFCFFLVVKVKWPSWLACSVPTVSSSEILRDLMIGWYAPPPTLANQLGPPSESLFSCLCWDPPNNWMDKRGPWVGGWMIQSMTSKKCENNLLTLVKTSKEETRPE